MPDWEAFVRSRIPSSALPPEIYNDVVVELASHLEETQLGATAAGLLEDAIEQIILQEVENWRELAATIERAKSHGARMNHRTRSLWLPALITLLGASLSLTLTQLAGTRPRLVWFAGVGIELYWPWLASLPLFGALGAYLSLRAKGSICARLLAGSSSALVMLTVMGIILPWGLLIDGFHFIRLVSFGIGLVNWVGVPLVALLIGAAPFLRGDARGHEAAKAKV